MFITSSFMATPQVRSETLILDFCVISGELTVLCCSNNPGAAL